MADKDKSHIERLKAWRSPVQKVAETETSTVSLDNVTSSAVADAGVNPENATGKADAKNPKTKKPITNKDDLKVDTDGRGNPDDLKVVSLTDVGANDGGAELRRWKNAEGEALAGIQKNAEAVVCNAPAVVKGLEDFENYLTKLEAYEGQQRKASGEAAVAQPAAPGQLTYSPKAYADAVYGTAQKIASGMQKVASAEERGALHARNMMAKTLAAAQENPALASVINAAGGLGAFTVKLAEDFGETVVPPELAAQGPGEVVGPEAGGVVITPEEEAQITAMLTEQLQGAGKSPEEIQATVADLAAGLNDGRITPEGLQDALMADLQAQGGSAEGSFTPEEQAAAQQLQAMGITPEQAAQLQGVLGEAAQAGIPPEEAVGALGQEIEGPVEGQKAASGEQPVMQQLRAAYRQILDKK